MFSELSVTIKDDEKKLNKKFTIYETYTVDENDAIIKKCVEETLENFDGTPENIKINIIMELR